MRKKAEPFVKVPLWWIEETARLTKSPTTLVLIELLRLHWKTKSLTFPLPNGRLQRLGVSRDVKRRVLRDLERARHRGRAAASKDPPRHPGGTLNAAHLSSGARYSVVWSHIRVPSYLLSLASYVSNKQVGVGNGRGIHRYR
jgi:hypothetical protein